MRSGIQLSGKPDFLNVFVFLMKEEGKNICGFARISAIIFYYSILTSPRTAYDFLSALIPNAKVFNGSDIVLDNS